MVSNHHLAKRDEWMMLKYPDLPVIAAHFLGTASKRVQCSTLPRHAYVALYVYSSILDIRICTRNFVRIVQCSLGLVLERDMLHPLQMGMILYGMAWRGVVWHDGMAWHGMVCAARQRRL